MAHTTAATTPMVPAAPAAPKRQSRPAIFISYRRLDTRFHVDMLAKQLRERFGDYQVFVDTREGEENLGEDYPGWIRQALASCDVLLVVIGKKWLDPYPVVPGLQRPWVHVEVSTGLARPRLRVIPVLVDGAPKPSAAQLPPDMRDLVDRFWIEIPDASWDFGVRILGQNIAEIVKSRDAGGVGAISLALPAATLAMFPLLVWRAFAPLYAPPLRTAAVIAIAAGAAAAIAGWQGASGTSRWLAVVSRAARRWQWAVAMAVSVAISAIGYAALRPLKVVLLDPATDRRMSFCDSTAYDVQGFPYEGTDQAGHEFDSRVTPCGTQFTAKYEAIAIRTGRWNSPAQGAVNISVSGGSLAAVAFPKEQHNQPKDGQQNIAEDLTVDHLPLDRPGNFVCWFTLASEWRRACVSVSLTMKGGELLGSDRACLNVP